MNKIIKTFLAFAVILLVITMYGMFFCSSHIHFERKITINQKKAIVFNYLNDYRNYNYWSPWYKMDTAAVYILEANQPGPGSVIRWKSEKRELGSGYVKIISTSGDSLIHQELNFSNTPSTSDFRLTENQGVTTLIWSLEFEVGSNPLLRIMGKFIDSMVKDDFENGLKNIKANSEKIIDVQS